MENRARYNAGAIANYLLSKGQMSPLKLQKLVYFAHGWYLALRDKPLLDEFVEAWEYGPVIPSLYHEFKRFGNGTIKDKATELDLNWELVEIPPPTDPDITSLLDRIWDEYGKFSPVELANMTHLPNSPWQQARETAQDAFGFVPKNVDISNEIIKSYFLDKLQK